MSSIKFGAWELWIFTPEEADSLRFPPNTYFAQVDPTCEDGVPGACPRQILSPTRFLGTFRDVAAALQRAQEHFKN